MRVFMAKEAGKKPNKLSSISVFFFHGFMMIFSVCFIFFLLLSMFSFLRSKFAGSTKSKGRTGAGAGAGAGQGLETGRTTNVEQRDFYGFTAGNDFFIGASLGRSRETMLLLFMALQTRFRFLSVYANMCVRVMCVCVCVFVGQLNPFCM